MSQFLPIVDQRQAPRPRVVQAYADAGFVTDLLPIIPADAVISASSNHPEHLRKSLGKVPGKNAGDGWVGFANWPEHHASRADIARWQSWGGGVGLQGRNFPGVDIDVDDEELATFIETETVLAFGLAPARFGRGARRLLPYRGSGLTKRRLAFRLTGRHGGPEKHAEVLRPDRGPGDAGRDDGVVAPRNDDPPVQAVEFLGAGQQYLVEGIHPKTLQPYFWRDDRSPAELGVDGLTEITAAQVDAFFETIEWGLVNIFGAEIVTRSLEGSNRGNGANQEGLLAPDLAAVQGALAAIAVEDLDYDGWVRSGIAVKAALGGSDEGYEAWEAWSLGYGDNTPEQCRAKWSSFKAPFSIGWNWLAQTAKPYGFRPSVHEFDTLPDQDEEEAAADDRAAALAATDMFGQCVWVERIQCVVDLRTLEPLNREQFNWRFANVGDPSDGKNCAWAVMGRSVDRRRTAKSLTYRPGSGLFVYEPDERGECVNIWKSPDGALPKPASAAAADRWLEHMTYLFGGGPERDTLIRWFAWVVQNPGEKPNWGVLIGSPHQGNGKSILLEPLRYALGGHNVRDLGVDDISSGYNGWVTETKLFVVEEMHAFGSKATMTRLKSLLSTPPNRLRVNPKFGRQFEVPNILTGVFFSNHADALALEKRDRRFFVLWTEKPPREAAYYTGLMAWFSAGGSAAVASYLMELDVSDFNAKGNAPATAAKREMHRNARPLLDEWIEDGMQEGVDFGTGPFGPRLVALDSLRLSIPSDFLGKNGRPSPQAFRAAMLKAGCRDLQTRMSLLPEPIEATTGPHGDLSQARLWSTRDHDSFTDLDPADLRPMFWEEHLRGHGGSNSPPPKLSLVGRRQ